jgi:SAM-dependent methyltransferase
MTDHPDYTKIKGYFQDKLDTYGSTPKGVDWNSTDAQEVRFNQLLKVVAPDRPFSVLDYGCGFGSLVETLRREKYAFQYTGYDLLETMVAQALQLHAGDSDCTFTARVEDLAPADYVMESGIFNICLDTPRVDWTAYVIETLSNMDRLSLKGFSFNMLTSYSDAEYMKPNLYYADPCFFFDYCKKHFSQNVALLHDYSLYDFTILVRKNLP